MKPIISIIAVIGKNRELGKNNQLIWRIPEDLKRFKKITKGHPVIMGQRTFESIGKPLPDRLNIILTRDEKYQPPGVQIVHSINEAIKTAKDEYTDEIFIIGGAQIFNQTINLTNKLYLTLVDKSEKADCFFPDYSEFKNTKVTGKGNINGLNYQYLELTK